jgi:hypothetical protein
VSYEGERHEDRIPFCILLQDPSQHLAFMVQVYKQETGDPHPVVEVTEEWTDYDPHAKLYWCPDYNIETPNYLIEEFPMKS